MMDVYELLYVVMAFAVQGVLIVFFALRKWALDVAVRYAWMVYALAVPAVLVSAVQFIGGAPWYFWIAGFLYLVWALFAFTVDTVLAIAWRPQRNSEKPVNWPVLAMYVGLYLAMLMFYWWPLAQVWRPLWYMCAVLFVASTVLNVTSHQWPDDSETPDDGSMHGAAAG